MGEDKARTVSPFQGPPEPVPPESAGIRRGICWGHGPYVPPVGSARLLSAPRVSLTRGRKRVDSAGHFMDGSLSPADSPSSITAEQRRQVGA